MATNHKQEGKIIDYINDTGADIVSGAVIAVGNLIGVALVDIADTETGSVQIDEVFTVPKATAAVIKQGESVTWIAANNNFDDNAATAVAGDIENACIAMESKGDGDLTIDIKLNVGVGAVKA